MGTWSYIIAAAVLYALWRVGSWPYVAAGVTIGILWGQARALRTKLKLTQKANGRLSKWLGEEQEISDQTDIRARILETDIETLQAHVDSTIVDMLVRVEELNHNYKTDHQSYLAWREEQGLSLLEEPTEVEAPLMGGLVMTTNIQIELEEERDNGSVK